LSIFDQSTGIGTDFVLLTYPPPGNDIPRINAMDSHPETGTLYASLNDGLPGLSENFLATVDVQTGAVRIVGPSVDGLDALAWTTGTERRVPDPANCRLSDDNIRCTTRCPPPSAVGDFSILWSRPSGRFDLKTLGRRLR